MKKLLLALLLFSPRAPQTQIAATSCSLAAIKAAGESAPAGSTITVPAGTSTETAGVGFAVAPNVRIVGPGGTGCVIIDAIDRTGYDAGLMEISTPSEGFELSGITFRGNGSPSTFTYNGSIRIYGATKKLRIHNNTFENIGRTVILVSGQIYGVIDHNKAMLPNGYFVRVNAPDWGGKSEGDGSWADDSNFGSEKFLFIEANTLTCPDAVSGGVNDSYLGGRWVIRDNDVDGCGVQTHPTGGSGRARGTRAFEVYRNTFRNTSGRCAFNGFFLSSGAGVFWGNTFSGCWSHMVTLHSMRVPPNNPYNQTPVPGGWGFYQSIYDVNGAFDMPGRGKSDLLSGAFPSVRNETKGCLVSPTCLVDQLTEGFYEWENVWANPGMGGGKVSPYEGNIILAGRDYFVDTKKPGYTPYTYPHPLVTGTSPTPPTTPNAPTGLTGVSGSSTTVTISWVDASSNETGFIVERCSPAACSNFAEVTRPGVNAVSFADAGLTPATPYRYRVFSFNADGKSAASNVADVTTQPVVPPTANMAPVITVMRLRSGGASGAILDPTQPITVNKVYIETDFTDDTGVDKADLLIKGQVVKTGFGQAQLDFTWTTAPAKGKGPVNIELITADFEGLITRKLLTVTVKK
jgi:hypothetical protein